MAKLKKPPTLLAPRVATDQELGEDLAAPAPSVGGMGQSGEVRRAIAEAFSGELTPALVLRALRAARDLSDVPFFVKTAMEVLRRSPHLTSLVETRVLTLLAQPLVAEPGGPKLQDKKASEAAQVILSSEALESALPHLALSSVYLGFGIAQCFYDTTSQPWTLTGITPVESHHVVFDREDARTPYLLPTESGGALQVLPANKFIDHRSGLGSGNPVASSKAYTAMFFEALKTITLKGWSGFVEIYGMPIRIGRFPKGMGKTPEGKKDLEVLKRALRDLGGDAWAMLPEDMQVEIIEAAGRNGSADVYERFCRFADEQLAKLFHGGSLTSGTGNTGSGGSQSLGTVHQDGLLMRVRADGKGLANSVRRCVLKQVTAWNFGPATAVPKCYFQFEEPEDVAVKVKAVCDLADRGFKVPAAEMYALLDIRAPEGDEDVIGAKAAPPAPAVEHGTPKAAMSAKFSAHADPDPAPSPDELDTLGAELLDSEEYALASAEADDALLNAIEAMSSNGAKALKDALTAAIRTADVSSLQALFTAGTTAARLAGEMAAELGTEG